MPSRVLINTILLLACIGLSLFLIYGPDNPPHPITPPLSDINRGTINHISIQRQGKPDLEFRKRQNRWSMIAPIQIAANPVRIDAILKLLDADSHARLDSKTIALNRFGLNPASVTLKLNDHEFQFGNTEPIDSRRYVTFRQTTHLVNDWLYHQLLTPAYFFPSLRLLPADGKIIGIRYPGADHQLNNGNWRSASPDSEMNAEDIRKLAAAWQTAVALSVAEISNPETNRHIQITLEQHTTPIQFSVPENATEFILARPDLGIQYQLPQSDKTRLLPESGSPDPDKTTNNTVTP